MKVNDWTLDNGRVITLLRPEDLKDLQKGSILYDIFGDRHVIGIDIIDNDTRGGYLAYGTLNDDSI